MPSDFGIGELLVNEWERFTEGLSTLSDGAARDARARASRRSMSDPRPQQINIPGWDDIVHAVPRPKATDDEKAAHYAAKRAGVESPLNPDLAFEVERRGRKARAIQASTSPGWAQAYGQVMTSLDNVQDLLTTVATVGRLTINPAIRVLDRLGPSFGTAALQEAQFLERRGIITAEQLAARRAVGLGLGTRLLGRAVPVLGWVLLGADLLKLVTQVGMLAFPAYALVCGGPRAAVAAGIPALLMGPALCKPIGAWAKINPFGRKAKLSRSRLARNWRPSIPNLIEVAQTTDSLFGVGLSVGAVVGTIQDAAFGIEQQRRGKDVQINTDGFSDSMHRIYSGQLARETVGGLQDLRAAATVLAYGPTLHGVQDVFTVEEHCESLIATCAALSILEPYMMAPETEEAMALIEGHALQPPITGEQYTRHDLAGESVPWPSERRWPLPGAPRTITPLALMHTGVQLVPDALRDLLRARRDEVVSTFIGAVVNRITERSAIWLTGTDDAITYQDAPVYQIMTSLALTNRWPNVGDGEAKVSAFFQAAENDMARLHMNSLDAVHLDSLAKLVGLQLIRGLPPDAPYPSGL